jgi:hypothetical protein
MSKMHHKMPVNSAPSAPRVKTAAKVADANAVAVDVVSAAKAEQTVAIALRATSSALTSPKAAQAWTTPHPWATPLAWPRA